MIIIEGETRQLIEEYIDYGFLFKAITKYVNSGEELRMWWEDKQLCMKLGDSPILKGNKVTMDGLIQLVEKDY
ncbi:hypothetical protein LCGC14_2824080 [marine sediment metagenome]|uniref:Uncharacterized protein n=1 Tax=marine sediment metagenome TaxID=412755 RepID=A0A0F9B7B7_9ZZZZ